MEREIISFETALSQIADSMEYASSIAPSFSNPPFVERLPAVVMHNSTIIDKVGAERCRVTTEIKLQIIKDGASCSRSQKNKVVCDLKCDAMEILNRLKAYTNIVDITKVNIYADTDFMAESDDVAVRVEATVVSNYTTYSQGVQIV